MPADGASGRALRFGTKGETLARVAPHVQRAKVPPLQVFDVARWRSQSDQLIAEIARRFGGRVVVRSSARAEDSAAESLAGAFRSIGGVDPADPAAVRAAVEAVIASYEVDGRSGRLDDHVLVQAQISDVALAGVLFTCDLETHAPYWVLSFDDCTGGTDAVTSGADTAITTVVRFKRDPHEVADARLGRIFALGSELETLFGCPNLDIELALGKDDTLYLLQVRRVATRAQSAVPSLPQMEEYLRKIAKKCDKLAQPHPDLAGERTLFGVMPDWNPAEMIGTKPRRLALSLYKELITDAIWAYQRDNYGYRNVRGFPLLVSLLGQPYVDVRASFNSFVPKTLDARIADKLVEYYLDELSARPSDHDKVEFNVVFSCAFPGFADKLRKLRERGFSDNEIDRIKFSLLELTNGIVSPARALWREDLGKVARLVERHAATMRADMSALHKIYWVLEDCKRYGTLPFAGLARAGFVAVQMLRGLVASGAMSTADEAAFMASLETISRRMTRDAGRMASGELPREAFVAEYGHLRPGTYDVQSPRYDEDFDAYFGGAAAANAHPAAPFELRSEQRRAIAALLAEEGFQATVDELFAFMRGAIEGREWGKFVFSRSVSDVLRLLTELGARFGISREDMSHVDIRSVLALYADLGAESLDEVLLADIARNKRAWSITRSLRLPALVRSPRDVYCFSLDGGEPNFVGCARVSAPVVTETELRTADLCGKVVFVRSADPGYDWLFARRIAGLVTQHGGTNSHMAIRAAELGLPSVIGCGEQNFERWSKARVVEIDCTHRVVRKVA